MTNQFSLQRMKNFNALPETIKLSPGGRFKTDCKSHTYKQKM